MAEPQTDKPKKYVIVRNLKRARVTYDHPPYKQHGKHGIFYPGVNFVDADAWDGKPGGPSLKNDHAIFMTGRKKSLVVVPNPTKEKELAALIRGGDPEDYDEAGCLNPENLRELLDSSPGAAVRRACERQLKLLELTPEEKASATKADPIDLADYPEAE